MKALNFEEQLKGKTLLLTGGTGFFGKALLDYFQKLHKDAELDLKVIVLSRDPEKFKRLYPIYEHLSWLSFETGDVTDFKSMTSDSPIDFVIHAAGESTLGPTLEPFDRFYKIINGAKNILEFSVKRGASRFLYVSSGAVYGSTGKEIPSLTEGDPLRLDPTSVECAYGLAKLASEHQAILFAKKYPLEVIIARCFSFSGKDLPINAHFALGNFIRDAITKRVIEINGSGVETRSYMDQRDLAIWLTSLVTVGQNGSIYNVGSDEIITIKALALRVRDLVSLETEIMIKGLIPPRQGRDCYIPNISKARSIGLTLNYGLNDSIAEMLKNFNNMDGGLV